jgi:hypothetical protein
MRRSASAKRFGRGVDGDRAHASGANQVRVVGEQFLDKAELVVTVGQAVMDVEGQLCLPVANGRPELGQRLTLVEVYEGLAVASSSFTTAMPV